MNDVRVVDNFLPQEVFKQLQEFALGGELPWYFSDTSVEYDDGCPQYSHTAYFQWQPSSFAWDYVFPTIMQINPVGLFRVKFNSTPKTSEIVEKPLHYDITNDDASQMPSYMICIIYLNDNNGYTYFETGDKIESKSNRAVFIPGNVKHAGSSCTDANRRVVLNINFA